MTKDLIFNGKIASLVSKARKSYPCKECGLPIEKGSPYYSVRIAGGGLGDKKFPDRVHVSCIDRHFNPRMTIDEAIGIHDVLTGAPVLTNEPRIVAALNLGIEALKFTLAVRGTILSYATLPLPGETEK